MKTYKANVLAQLPDTYAMQVGDTRWEVLSVIGGILTRLSEGPNPVTAWRNAAQRLAGHTARAQARAQRGRKG